MWRAWTFLVLILSVESVVGATDRIYWTGLSSDAVYRANLGSGAVETLATLPAAGGGPQGIAVDPVGGKMYWNHSGLNTIYGANENGTSMLPLVQVDFGSTMQSSLRGIALDVVAGKMYWADMTDYGHTGRISRANLNGSNVELITESIGYADDLALDLTAGKMYWNDFYYGRIGRANLDGSNVETVLSGLNRIYGIALDFAAQKIYFSDDMLAGSQWTRRIARCDFDGSNVQSLITGGLNDVRGIAVDGVNGRLYWADFGNGKIQRSALDGSGVQDVITGLSQPTRIALVVPEPSLAMLVPVALVARFLGRRRGGNN